MVARRVHNLRHFLEVVESGDRFPFYCMLLYTPNNGMDQKLHEYVPVRWWFLDTLTGDSCLLLALEDQDTRTTIQDFKPEDVYTIGRELGVAPNALPCAVFFTQPKRRKDTLILRLVDVLPKDGQLSEADLTAFFRDIATVLDSCSSRPAGQRLNCLRDGLTNRWPPTSRWHAAATKAAGVVGWLAASAVTA